MEGDSRPVPDPTLLTTEQLLREIAHVREIGASELEAMGALFSEKFSAMEKYRIEREAVDQRALDAAFAASKEEISGVKVSVADLKDRVIRMESVKVGGQQAYTAVYALAGFIVSLIVIGGFAAAFSK